MLGYRNEATILMVRVVLCPSATNMNAGYGAVVPDACTLSVNFYCKYFLIPAGIAHSTLTLQTNFTAIDKDNQDAYCVHPSFGKVTNGNEQAFFGVFDGHGRDGHHCARYARDRVREEWLISGFSSVSRKNCRACSR